MGFTLVVDAGSIIGLIIWAIIIILALTVLLWVLGNVFGFLGEVGETVSELMPAKNQKKPTSISVGNFLLYLLIETVITWGLGFALIATNNGVLMAIGVLIFFSSFYGWYYLSERFKVKPLEKPKKK